MSTFTLQDLNLPTTVDEAIKTMAEMSKVDAVLSSDLGLKIPEMGEVLPNPTLESILKTIGEQFALLSTVITQAKAQPNTTPPEGNPPPLQETIELVLQQSDWFAEMVRQEVMSMDFDDTLEGQVERYCENYFSYNFDPKDHFDIDGVIQDCVDDEIDQAVEEYMSNATLTIERG